METAFSFSWDHILGFLLGLNLFLPLDFLLLCEKGSPLWVSSPAFPVPLGILAELTQACTERMPFPVAMLLCAGTSELGQPRTLRGIGQGRISSSGEHSLLRLCSYVLEFDSGQLLLLELNELERLDC